MNVLLSIQPSFAMKILDGTKHFEFRKSVPSHNIDKVYIYATTPLRRVVGEFKIDVILCDRPEKIWEQTHEEAGITEDKFFSYFKGADQAYAIRIKDVVRYDHPITLSCRPPQNFIYIDKIGSVTNITL